MELRLDGKYRVSIGDWGVKVEQDDGGPGTLILGWSGKVADATGYPASLITEAARLLEQWKKDNPGGELICDGWRLYPDPNSIGPSRRKYAKSDKVEVYFDHSGLRSKLRIGDCTQHPVTVVPTIVIMAILRAAGLV